MEDKPAPSPQAAPDKLPPGKSMLRLMFIGGLVGGIAVLFACAGGWLSPRKLTPARLVNTFEQVNGLHPGFRRNHAKGVCVSGRFESNGRGAALSKAKVFLPGSVPILGRFAFAGGQPFVPDDPHLVRSLAILFQLPNGEEWRTGMITLPVFVVSTPQEFHDQLVAFAPEPDTGKPNPASVNAFLRSHPESAKALQLIRSQPVSSGFGNSTYYGLNAFHFINAAGATVPVRWSAVPEQPFEPVNTSGSSSQKETNYLFNALIAAIHQHPLQWRLIITIGQPEDSTADAARPWPAERQQVDAGTVIIDQVQSEDTSPVRDLTFDPLILPNGIAGSDDPLLSARSGTYARAFTRREGEPKTPSAISAAEAKK